LKQEHKSKGDKQMSTLRDIKVRKVDFDLKTEIPIRWFKNNLLISQFVNSLHLIFPDGEKFFIRSVKAHEDFVKDEELRRQVKAFIGQEMIHGKEHRKFWETMEKQGYHPERFLEFYNSTCYDTFETRINQWLGPKYSLSVTVALEHFTASLAEFAFKDMNELDGVPEEMRQMLLWHASEEIEHKSVAFDVLKQVDDSYRLRVIGMLYATISLSVFTFIGFLMLLSEDFAKGRSISFGELLEFLTHFTKLVRTLGKEILNYLRPDFHPDQVHNESLANYFFKNYKVERGNSSSLSLAV
jgi:predicted metal-dependent hydrolase